MIEYLGWFAALLTAIFAGVLGAQAHAARKVAPAKQKLDEAVKAEQKAVEEARAEESKVVEAVEDARDEALSGGRDALVSKAKEIARKL